MALQVWLPLLGDLTNNGLTNANITNSNATISNDGKIGKCYSFNGNSQKLISTLPLAVSSSIGTLACWVKFNAFPASGKWMCLMQLGTSGGFAACRLGVYMEYTNGINICIDGSSTAGNLYTHSLSTNTWYHLCATNDGTNVKLYLNGEVVLSKIATKGTYTTSAPNLYIGGTNNYYLNGYLNDIRYYDTCLSPKEVEILARGLVVHYPMTGGGRGGANLAKGTNTASTSTNTWGFSEATGGSTRTIEVVDGVNCAKITRNTTTHSSWSYMWYGNWDRAAIEPDTWYTLSMDVIASGSGSIGLSAFMQGNATNSITDTVETIQATFNADNWSHLVYHIHTISSFEGKGTNQTIYMNCSYLTNVSVWAMMKNFHLEKGKADSSWIPHTSDPYYTSMGYNDNTEYDVNGYNNHSTYTSLPTYDSSSARYETSAYFGTTGNPNTSLINTSWLSTLTNGTISWWFKYTTGNSLPFTSDSNTHYIAAGASGTNLYDSNIGASGITMYKDGVVVNTRYEKSGSADLVRHDNVRYNANEWHHFCLTGINLSTWTDFKINAYGSWHLRGYLSDIRIYATVLTAQQVAELYNTSASIANNGTLLAYEFIEN